MKKQGSRREASFVCVPAMGLNMVPGGGLEPPRVASYAPQTYASASSAIPTILVPKVGFEPTRAIAHGALNTACLPVSPLRLTPVVVYQSFDDISSSEKRKEQPRSRLPLWPFGHQAVFDPNRAGGALGRGRDWTDDGLRCSQELTTPSRRNPIATMPP